MVFLKLHSFSDSNNTGSILRFRRKGKRAAYLHNRGIRKDAFCALCLCVGCKDAEYRGATACHACGLRACGAARDALRANGNLRLTLAVFAAQCCGAA